MPATAPNHIYNRKPLLIFINHIILETKLDTLLSNRDWLLSNIVIDAILNHPQLTQLMETISSYIKVEDFQAPPAKYKIPLINAMLSCGLYENIDANNQEILNVINTGTQALSIQAGENYQILRQMINFNEEVNWSEVEHSNIQVPSSKMRFIPINRFIDIHNEQIPPGFGAPSMAQFIICYSLFCDGLGSIVYQANQVACWVQHRHNITPDNTQDITGKIENAVRAFLTQVITQIETTIINAIEYKTAIQLLAEAAQEYVEKYIMRLPEGQKSTENLEELFQVIAVLVAYVARFEKAQSIVSTYNTSPEWANSEISPVFLKLTSQYIQDKALLEQIETLFARLKENKLDPEGAKQVIKETLEKAMIQETLTEEASQFTELKGAIEAILTTLPKQSAAIQSNRFFGGNRNTESNGGPSNARFNR